MFMNARPRPDLYGFRTFVPSRIVELSYHRPYSMTNHGTNTWSTLRGTSSLAATPEAWSYCSGLASNSENYSTHSPQNFYSDFSAGSMSYDQTQVENYSMTSASKMEGNSKPQPTSTIRLESRSPYDFQEIQSPHLESVMPIFVTESDPRGWTLDQSATNSSRFLGAHHSSTARSFADGSSLEVNNITSASSSATVPSFFSPYDTLSSSQYFGATEREPETSCISRFEQGIASCPSFPAAATSTTARAIPRGFNAGRLWDEKAQKSNLIDPCGMIMPFTYDGLPHGHSTFWSGQSGPSQTWSQHTAPPGTVSPQALSLTARSSSPIPGENSPISNSGWDSETGAFSRAVQKSVEDMPHPPRQMVGTKTLRMQNSGTDISDSTMQSMTSKASYDSQATCDILYHANQPSKSNPSRLLQPTVGERHTKALSIFSSPTNTDNIIDDSCNPAEELVTWQKPLTQQSIERPQYPVGRVLRPRRKLPSDRDGEAYVSPHSNQVGVPNKPQKGLAVAISHVTLGTKDNAQPPLINARTHPRKACALQRPLTSEKLETRLAEKGGIEIARDSLEYAETASKINDVVLQRFAKDKFLLDAKREGKSYKQIRKEGCFTEAESTLRGRHRTLTKRPEERVRKPEWESNDLRLLKNAVHELVGDSGLQKPKIISWKEVSNYIVENGGSYRFGNSTCRKKWSELFAKYSDYGLS